MVYILLMLRFLNHLLNSRLGWTLIDDFKHRFQYVVEDIDAENVDEIRVAMLQQLSLHSLNKNVSQPFE